MCTNFTFHTLLVYKLITVSGSQVAFQQNEYPVTEGAGIVTVCVALLGDPLTFSVFVRVTTQDGTARGKHTYT